METDNIASHQCRTVHQCIQCLLLMHLRMHQTIGLTDY